MKQQKYALPIIALIIANILWGLNTPFIKLGLETIPVPIFISIRFLAASLILLPFAVKTWKPLKRKDFLLLILCSILYISVSAFTLNIGLSKTSGSDAAVITLLAPLLLFILSVEFLKERLNVKTLTGIMVALAGAAVIIGNPLGTGGNLTGNLFILVSVLSAVVGTIIFKPLIKKTSSYQATFMSLFFGILPIAAYALIQLHTWDIKATTTTSLKGLGASIIAIVIANFLFFYALKRKNVQSTGVYDYLQAVVTIVASWWLLSERPSSTFALGAALVFAGIFLAEMHKSRHLQLHHRKTSH